MEPRIVSVNVGQLRLVGWRGRAVKTGMYKEPVGGPILASGVNLTGDLQADRRIHGGADKALYAYARADYDWWESELGARLGAGTFGENLTTSGLDLTESAVGDRWRVGEAILEVTQPREPCFKLGIRMGDGAFVKRFRAARRPGVYLRIIEPGHVAAGDTIAVVPAADPALRIVDLLRLQ